MVTATFQSPTPQDLSPFNDDDLEFKKGPSGVFRARFTDTPDLIVIGVPSDSNESEISYLREYPAQVAVDGTRFRLSYTDPAKGLEAAPAEQRVTQFTYMFRRTGD